MLYQFSFSIKIRNTVVMAWSLLDVAVLVGVGGRGVLTAVGALVGVAVAVGIGVAVGRGRGCWPGTHPGGSQGWSVRVLLPRSTRTRSAAGTTGPLRCTRA